LGVQAMLGLYGACVLGHLNQLLLGHLGASLGHVGKP
jgi:hypothetical protein